MLYKAINSSTVQLQNAGKEAMRKVLLTILIVNVKMLWVILACVFVGMLKALAPHKLGSHVTYLYLRLDHTYCTAVCFHRFIRLRNRDWKRSTCVKHSASVARVNHAQFAMVTADSQAHQLPTRVKQTSTLTESL